MRSLTKIREVPNSPKQYTAQTSKGQWVFFDSPTVLLDATNGKGCVNLGVSLTESEEVEPGEITEFTYTVSRYGGREPEANMRVSYKSKLEKDMGFSSNLTNDKQNDLIGVQMLSSRNIMQADTEPFKYEPAKAIKQSGEEFFFEIDHALPIGANIAIKTREETPDPKAMDGVYEVYRGRIRGCKAVERSHGSRYEVCVKILETVLQTEVVTSRLSRN